MNCVEFDEPHVQWTGISWESVKNIEWVLTGGGTRHVSKLCYSRVVQLSLPERHALVRSNCQDWQSRPRFFGLLAVYCQPPIKLLPQLLSQI
jgi:hypothetical protein